MINLEDLIKVNSLQRETEEYLYATDGNNHFILEHDGEIYTQGDEEKIGRYLKLMQKRSVYSAERKIVEVDDLFITFSDGTRMGFTHDQECCEANYADFEQIDDLARDYTFKGKLLFESVPAGFRFGDSRRMFFVPCYSRQNGWYTTNVDILIDGNVVLSTKAKMIDEWE